MILFAPTGCAQIAAEPYQTVSFKIQAREIDSSSLSSLPLHFPLTSFPLTGTEGMSWEHWDPDTKTLSMQFLFAQNK